MKFKPCFRTKVPYV